MKRHRKLSIQLQFFENILNLGKILLGLCNSQDFRQKEFLDIQEIIKEDSSQLIQINPRGERTIETKIFTMINDHTSIFSDI